MESRPLLPSPPSSSGGAIVSQTANGSADGRAMADFDQPEVHVMFPVPLLTIRLKRAEGLNKSLLAEIAKRRKAEPGIERSNRYGWHSGLDLFERSEPAHAELARALDEVVATASRKLIPEMPEDFVRRHEGWINVSPTHAMNAPHDHAGAFWSGCYYIEVP